MTVRVTLAGPIDVGAFASRYRKTDASPIPQGHPGSLLLATLGHALIDAGLEVTVVTTDHRIPEEVVVQLGNGVTICVVAGRPVGYGRDLLRLERRRIAQAIREFPADVVHAHWTYEFALGALAASVAPVIVSVHDWAPRLLRLAVHPFNFARMGMQVVSIHRADIVVANSPYIQSRVQRLRARVPLVPNPIEDCRFDWSPYCNERRGNSLLAVNNGFTPLKNVSTLLSAFARIKRRMSDAKLVLVGPGYEPGGSAFRWADRHSYRKGVVFRGRLPPEEVREEMRRAVLFVHPSLEESFGSVLTEAMSVGTPVLGGIRSGAVGWVLGEGAYGQLCNVADAGDLERAVYGALGDGMRLSELAQRGRASAWMRFRSTVVAPKWVEVYREVA